MNLFIFGIHTDSNVSMCVKVDEKTNKPYATKTFKTLDKIKYFDKQSSIKSKIIIYPTLPRLTVSSSFINFFLFFCEQNYHVGHLGSKHLKMYCFPKTSDDCVKDIYESTCNYWAREYVVISYI